MAEYIIEAGDASDFLEGERGWIGVVRDAKGNVVAHSAYPCGTKQQAENNANCLKNALERGALSPHRLDVKSRRLMRRLGMSIPKLQDLRIKIVLHDDNVRYVGQVTTLSGVVLAESDPCVNRSKAQAAAEYLLSEVSRGERQEAAESEMLKRAERFLPSNLRSRSETP